MYVIYVWHKGKLKFCILIEAVVNLYNGMMSIAIKEIEEYK
jgi:hypothetical protein